MMKKWAYEVDSQLLASQQTDLQLSFMMIIIKVWSFGMVFRVLPSSIDQTVKTPEFLIAKIIQNGYLDGVCYTAKLFDNVIVTNSYKN